MDEELARFEEKQKIANLQIDKRIATLELSFEDLKSEFENISIPKNVDEKIAKIERDFSLLKNDLGQILSKEKERNDIIADLNKKYDINTVKNDFDKLLQEVAIMKTKIRPVESLDQKLAEIEKLRQMMNMESRGKLPQCREDVEQVNLKIRILEEKISKISSRFDQLGDSINAIRAIQPMIIE